jgi:predicted dehydrogenase
VQKLRWGVIGAGGIADRRTIPEGIIPAANAELVAVNSSTEDSSRKIGEKYGVRHYTAADALLADPDVDAVYIATPNHLHQQQCIAAARAGKHVLCEKPLALTLEETKTISAAVAEAGVKLGMGYMMRHNVYHQHLRQLVESGELGNIVFARAQLTCWYPPMDGAWRQELAKGGGGALMDLTVHCLDLLEMILGPIEEVSGYVEQRVHDYPVDDSNALLLKFKSGAFGFVDCAFNIPDEASENALELQGSRGCVKARLTIGQGGGGDVQVCQVGGGAGYDAAQTRPSGAYEPLVLDPVNPYLAQIEEFSDAVLSNREPAVGIKAGIRGMELVEAIRRAVQSRRMETV